jgi:hypothetical protein
MRITHEIGALVLAALLAGCVEQPKDLSKEQVEAAKPFILKARPAYAHTLDINFEDYVTLLGYDIAPEGAVKPGQAVTITWYWQSKKKLDDGWLLFTHVEDAKTTPRINADNDGVIRKNYPPGKWKPGEFIKDVQNLTVPRDWDSPTMTFYIGIWFGPHRLQVKTGPHDKENRARALVVQTTVKPKEEAKALLGVRRAEGAIKVDGKLDDKAWAAAAPVELVDPVSGGKMLPPTSVRALWDDTTLYVAFEAEDDHLQSTYKKRDEPLYDQDAVEVFLDPDGDQKKYYEFEVSPAGVIFDSFLPEYRKNQNDWNGGITAAVAADGTLNKADDVDKKYVAEIAIPFKDVAPAAPKAGEKWKANFFRLDTMKEGRKAYAWSAPKNMDFHNLDRFGELLFEEKKTDTPAAAAAPAPLEPVKGGAGAPAQEKAGTAPTKPTLKKLMMPPKVAIPAAAGGQDKPK